jgi:hypothetical protein
VLPHSNAFQNSELKTGTMTGIHNRHLPHIDRSIIYVENGFDWLEATSKLVSENRESEAGRKLIYDIVVTLLEESEFQVHV